MAGGRAGGGGGGGRGRSDKPVEPLGASEAEAVRELLEAGGGQLAGGVVSSKVPGVKKAQLQERFQVHDVPSGDFFVLLPAGVFDAEKAVASEPPGHRRRRRSAEGGADGDGAQRPLAMVTLVELQRVLDANGGQISGGAASSKVPGLKKASLEPYFSVHHHRDFGDYHIVARGREFSAEKAARKAVPATPSYPWQSIKQLPGFGCVCLT